MAEHTPTPWRTNEPHDSNYALEIVGTNSRGNEELVCRPPGKRRNANAAFIVKAVNNHDALVKALSDVLNKHVGLGVSPEIVQAKAVLQAVVGGAQGNG